MRGRGESRAERGVLVEQGPEPRPAAVRVQGPRSLGSVERSRPKAVWGGRLSPSSQLGKPHGAARPILTTPMAASDLCAATTLRQNPLVNLDVRTSVFFSGLITLMSKGPQDDCAYSCRLANQGGQPKKREEAPVFAEAHYSALSRSSPAPTRLLANLLTTCES